MTSRVAPSAAFSAILALLTACGTSASKPAPDIQRPTTSLRSALLTAAELGPGFSMDPTGLASNPTAGAGASATCQDLASIFFADQVPSSLSYASIAFDRPGETGGEEIAAMGTSAKAKTLVERLRTDVANCPALPVFYEGATFTFDMSLVGSDAQTMTFASQGEGLAAPVHGLMSISVVGDTLVLSTVGETKSVDAAQQLERKAVAKARSKFRVD